MSFPCNSMWGKRNGEGMSLVFYFRLGKRGIEEAKKKTEAIELLKTQVTSPTASVRVIYLYLFKAIHVRNYIGTETLFRNKYAHDFAHTCMQYRTWKIM